MKHPLSICGAVVFGGSWIFLLTGVGSDDYHSVVNLHKLAIAHAGILSGLGMIVTGYLAEGIQLLRGPRSSEVSDGPRDLEPQPIARPTMSREELSKAIEEARAKLDQR